MTPEKRRAYCKEGEAYIDVEPVNGWFRNKRGIPETLTGLVNCSNCPDRDGLRRVMVGREKDQEPVIVVCFNIPLV